MGLATLSCQLRPLASEIGFLILGREFQANESILPTPSILNTQPGLHSIEIIARKVSTHRDVMSTVHPRQMRRPRFYVCFLFAWCEHLVSRPPPRPCA